MPTAEPTHSSCDIKAQYHASMKQQYNKATSVHSNLAKGRIATTHPQLLSPHTLQWASTLTLRSDPSCGIQTPHGKGHFLAVWWVQSTHTQPFNGQRDIIQLVCTEKSQRTMMIKRNVDLKLKHAQRVSE